MSYKKFVVLSCFSVTDLLKILYHALFCQMLCVPLLGCIIRGSLFFSVKCCVDPTRMFHKRITRRILAPVKLQMLKD